MRESVCACAAHNHNNNAVCCGLARHRVYVWCVWWWALLASVSFSHRDTAAAAAAAHIFCGADSSDRIKFGNNTLCGRLSVLLIHFASHLAAPAGTCGCGCGCGCGGAPAAARKMPC